MPARHTFWLLCLAEIGNLAAAPDPPMKFPDTRLAAETQEWLRLCEAAQLEPITQWLSAHLSEQITKTRSARDIARQGVDFCTENGGLRPFELLESSPRTLAFKAVGIKSGAWFEIRRGTDEAGKLNAGGNLPTLPPESVLPKDASDASLRRQLADQVAKQAQAGRFSGIVMVARGVKVIASASGGFANRERRIPFTGESQFTIGSMGKLFTATAVGQLIDGGKMALGDTVGRFFPDYPNTTVREKVTVEMLLSHTAGMGDFLGKRPPAMMKDGVKRAAEFMPLYDKDEPAFAPGTSWSYSNAGLALAGAIIEKLSGEDYPDYIRRHVFEAAGMSNSDPNNVPRTLPALVTPYTKFSEQNESSDWQEASHDIGSPAGGAVSTADDLIRFAEALRSGKLMRKATFESLTKINPRSPPDFPYADAFEVHDIYGRKTVGHGGGFPGVATDLKLFADSPYTIVWLQNIDPPLAADASAMVTALVAERLKAGKVNL